MEVGSYKCGTLGNGSFPLINTSFLDSLSHILLQSLIIQSSAKTTMFDSNASEKRYGQLSSDERDYTAPIDMKFLDLLELDEYDCNLSRDFYTNIHTFSYP